MTPSADQMQQIRTYAMELIRATVPFKQGDAKYKEVVETTGWRKTDTSGTTCGFLCHWMMWKLGVKERTILNWTDTARGTKFTSGRNIDMIWNKRQRPFIQIAEPYAPPAKTNPQMNLLELGASMGGIGGPQPGDCVFIREPGGSPHSEHVFVFCGATRKPGGVLEWSTAESGQANGTDADPKTRVVQLSGNLKGYTKISGNDPIRTIIGWLDLGQLDYDEAAVQKIMTRTVSA